MTENENVGWHPSADLPAPPPPDSGAEGEAVLEDDFSLNDDTEFESNPEPDEEKKRLTELNEEEAKALRDNAAYWESRELAFAGRLADTFEFLPGRRVSIHTLDAGEQIFLGKVLDGEFGKIGAIAGMPTELPNSYQIGVQIITLSLAIDQLDGEPVYVPLNDKEDVYNDELSVNEREAALAKKSLLVRRKMQTWFPPVIKLAYRKYLDLGERQDAAVELLPFYSATGQLLPNSRPTGS